MYRIEKDRLVNRNVTLHSRVLWGVDTFTTCLTLKLQRQTVLAKQSDHSTILGTFL